MIDYDVATDLQNYAIDLLIFTAGCGVLIAIIMGMCMCVFCVYWFATKNKKNDSIPLLFLLFFFIE